jgi:phenylalanyl-tRNA synthetase beta subunit
LVRKNDLPEEQTRLIVTAASSDYYHFKGKLEALLDDLEIKNLDLDIKSDSGIFYWEIPISKLLQLVSDNKTYIPISKFTPIIEDVNLTLSGPYSSLKNKISEISDLIKQIDLVDQYGSKLTLRITYHSDKKQLSSDDIAPIREKITKAL